MNGPPPLAPSPPAPIQAGKNTVREGKTTNTAIAVEKFTHNVLPTRPSKTIMVHFAKRQRHH
jgi:hypothetical protein